MPALRRRGTLWLMLRRLLRDLFDFIYPGFCAHCQKTCIPGEFLCDQCEAELTKLQQAPACEPCGMPLAYPEAPCPFCQGKGIPHYDRILRLATFEEPLKGLIHQFKYRGQWTVGTTLADRLLDWPPITAMLCQTDVLVPVPLHWRRRFHRGFNQAEVIAAPLAGKLGLRIAHPLRRIRNTETQTLLHARSKRFKNLKDAFRLIDPRSIRDQRVLLIDDVMTTGATLQAVARALRPARPRSLSALVLAVADPRGRRFTSV
jgi:ComF family protein